MWRLMWARPLSHTRAVVLVPENVLTDHRWRKRSSFWDQSPEGAFSIT